MNILVLAPQPFYQQRGTPIAVKMLVEELAMLQHRVALLVYHEGENLPLQGVQLHRVPRLPLVSGISPGPSWKKLPCDLAMFFKALGIIRKNRIDLIHAVEESAFLALAFKFLYRIPYVYDMDSSLAEQTTQKWKLPRPLSSLLESLEKLAVRHSSGVLAVCRALEEKANRFAPGKLIHRLEDVTMLKTGDSGSLIRQELGITGPIVLYVGNLESYQGIDLLLESFAVGASDLKGAHLVIIGGTSEHIRQHTEKTKALGILPLVHFLGVRPLDHLAWYLQQADVVVSPRTQGNNTPMKIYSYLDCGRPVLATRLHTHTQVLDDEIALLVEPTPTAMAEGMKHLLDNPDLGNQMAMRARERVEQEYSPAAFTRKLTRFYQALEPEISAKPLNIAGPIHSSSKCL